MFCCFADSNLTTRPQYHMLWSYSGMIRNLSFAKAACQPVLTITPRSTSFLYFSGCGTGKTFLLLILERVVGLEPTLFHIGSVVPYQLGDTRKYLPGGLPGFTVLERSRRESNPRLLIDSQTSQPLDHGTLLSGRGELNTRLSLGKALY